MGRYYEKIKKEKKERKKEKKSFPRIAAIEIQNN